MFSSSILILNFCNILFRCYLFLLLLKLYYCIIIMYSRLLANICRHWLPFLSCFSSQKVKIHWIFKTINILNVNNFVFVSIHNEKNVCNFFNVVIIINNHYQIFFINCKSKLPIKGQSIFSSGRWTVIVSQYFLHLKWKVKLMINIQ